MKHILFVCSQNKLRSPTGECVFANYPGVETRSAGLNNDAEVSLGVEDELVKIFKSSVPQFLI